MSDIIADYSPASFRRSKSRSRSKSRHREGSGGHRRREKKEKKRRRRSQESSDDGDKHRRRRRYSDDEKEGRHRDRDRDRDRRDGRRDRDRSRSRHHRHRRHRSSPGREKEEERGTGPRSATKPHHDDGHERPSKRYRDDAIPAAAGGGNGGGDGRGGRRGHDYRGGGSGQRLSATGERQHNADGWGNNYNYELAAQYNDQYRNRNRGGSVGGGGNDNREGGGGGGRGGGGGGAAVAAAPPQPPPRRRRADRGPAPPSPPTAPLFQLLGQKYGLDWNACNDVDMLTALLDRATIPIAHNITRPDWVATGEIIAALHPPVDAAPFSDEALAAGPQIEEGKFIDADSTQEPYPIAWEVNKKVNDPRLKYVDDYKALKIQLQQEKLPLPAWAVEEKEDGGGETTSGLSWSQSPRQMAAKRKEMEAQSRLKVEKERMQMQQVQEQQQKQLLPGSQGAVQQQQQQQKSLGKPKTVGPATDGELLDAPPAPRHDEVFDEDGGGGGGGGGVGTTTTGRRQLATGSVYRHGAPRTGERERGGGGGGRGGLLLRSGKVLAEPGYIPLSSGYFLPLQRDGTFGENPLESQQQYEVLKEKAKKGEIPEWVAYRGEDRLWMPLGEQVPPVEGVEDLKWRGAASRPTATTGVLQDDDDEKKKKKKVKEEEEATKHTTTKDNVVSKVAALPKAVKKPTVPACLFGSREPGRKQDDAAAAAAAAAGGGGGAAASSKHMMGGWFHHQKPSLAVRDPPINIMPGDGGRNNNNNNNNDRKRKQPYVSQALAYSSAVTDEGLPAWRAAQNTLSSTKQRVTADIIREANTTTGNSGGGGGGEEEGDGTRKRRRGGGGGGGGGEGGLNVWGGPPPVHTAAAIRGELMESFASTRGTGSVSQRDVDGFMKKMINQSIKKLADQRAQKKG